MPRIEPIRLLNCLRVLLSDSGGIKDVSVIGPLARLMTTYSKKLVSKCIYIQILKCTDLELLALFMGCGGWRLVHMWLTESIVAQNWPLVRELLELLLLCPVDIERLKTNNNPKLVKELSKDGNHFDIRVLASKLVEQWLKIVKGEQVTLISISDIPQIIAKAQEAKSEVVKPEIFENGNVDNSNEVKCDESNNTSYIDANESIKEESPPEEEDTSVADNLSEVKETVESDREQEAIPIIKLSLKNGKQIITQVEVDKSQKKDSSSDTERVKDKSKSRSKDKEKEKSSERRSSSSSKSSSSKHSSKSSSSSSDKNKHRSSKHSDSKEKSKDKEKDKHRHSSDSSKSKHSSSSSRKSSSSSSKSKDDKDSNKPSEKDKVKDDKDDKAEDKPLVPSIHKLGKIPKLSDVKKEKPSISIEVRKPDEPKPKTVKTFHSRFRKHGLEEEVKPPPSRASLLSNKKPPPALPPTVSIPKRPSPVHNETPPEKKPKMLEINEIKEKPGSIKLIPAKPKPMVLQESDMFMDALNASATNKKEPKKRKRRTSGSKDGNPSSDGSPPHTPTITSPNSENKSVPPRFYQDTLDNDENKDSKEKADENKSENETSDISENNISKDNKIEVEEPHTLTINGIKGVLCYHKRKGPKKSIKWKPDSELEEIQYFELDETERVNVTKTFTDMKYLERVHEREAFQKARNLINDDVMEEKTSWKPLILIDVEGQTPVEYGKNSKEKDIQAIRQKGTLQPLYFYKSMIPDSPLEPDVETHTYSEPTIIPLEDVTGNQDNISDFRNMPWPEPKGNAPPTTTNNTNVAPIFPTNMAQFPASFPGPQFPGVPGFQGPPIMPGEWPNGVPPMMPNGMPGTIPTPGMPPGPMPPGNLPPGLMVPPDNMMMGPDMFGGPNPMFPVGPDGFNMQQNMFPVDFNMGGPQGPPGPDGFPGPGNFRGAMRGRGVGGHWRGKAPGNWDMSQRGRGGRGGGRKAVCIYFQRKGSCRQGDNCSFLHPGVNCPF
ncbi:serine/threonine-protein phosphatase 1 regulatory subunit 10 [Colias croceus]|uniref:serine/threonine-protein phosphatase 1 regulatory subunit 10 n=1 Tax=Colias crocea TaxID=72248 RepID=UPI001E27CA66|nr:serine/threonine-protein phosphatase 1 regulatory subunit 10 [Colias croceus]